jgi:hypothetical protein
MLYFEGGREGNRVLHQRYGNFVRPGHGEVAAVVARAVSAHLREISNYLGTPTYVSAAAMKNGCTISSTSYLSLGKKLDSLRYSGWCVRSKVWRLPNPRAVKVSFDYQNLLK